MKGYRRESTYDSDKDDPEYRRTKKNLVEIFVPDAGLLFQRVPLGVIQPSGATDFPKKDLVGWCDHGVVNVSYQIVCATRRYLKEREHLQSQITLLQQTLEKRIKELQTNEARFQWSVRALKRI